MNWLLRPGFHRFLRPGFHGFLRPRFHGFLSPGFHGFLRLRHLKKPLDTLERRASGALESQLVLERGHHGSPDVVVLDLHLSDSSLVSLVRPASPARPVVSRS